MTVYVVGPGGHDGNSGRTWQTRLATLNGAEDKPVVPGDTVYVAPGAYRESLTVDVSGTAAKPITYIGDVTGEHTDGVGGIVRITGSDNDQTLTRTSCINATSKDYRTFRGFMMDTATILIDISSSDYWTIEDCALWRDTDNCIDADGTSTNLVVRRCIMTGRHAARTMYIINAPAIDNTGDVVENCIFFSGRAVRIDGAGDVQVRNSLFIGSEYGVRTGNANAGHETDVRNSIFTGCSIAVRGEAAGQLTEDYNTFYINSTDRSNVNVGANSNAYTILFQPPLRNAGVLQQSGYRLPWWFSDLSQWSQIAQITGDGNEPTVDFFGQRRPYTHGGPISALCSWGTTQRDDFQRSDIRAYDGNLSVLVRKAQKTRIFVPGISNVQTTISARGYRTAGYGGHRNPEMVIKQPGQADRRTVLGGAAGAWVQGSDTFTPAANPHWLEVELWNLCDFTTTTTVSTTSTTTQSTTSTTTQTVSTLTTTTTTLACDVWWDDLQVA